MSRAVIFANGLLSDPSEVRGYIYPGDLIICADGGTRHALTLGLHPDLIVGDLDSLASDMLAEMKARGVPLETYPADKDQTDLELALHAARRAGVDEVLLLTALGGRLDQTLANVLLLTRPEWASLRLNLADGRQCGTVLRDHGQLVLPGTAGDTLSLIPLTPRVTGVSLDGVRWPLTNATVELGTTKTVSNEFTSSTVTVRIGQGMALVVHISG
jgi:thiamine pyrophosphokinase